MAPPVDLAPYRLRLRSVDPFEPRGRVIQGVGMVIEAAGPACRIGAVCEIHTPESEKPLAAEVMGFRDGRVLLMPLEEIRGIGPGCRVVAKKERAAVAVGEGLLGRVIDGRGLPIDGRGPVAGTVEYPLYTPAMNPLLRRRIGQPLDLGIRAINTLMTVGCGQRIGIFAGSGVGKSVLLGMIARHTTADVNVIALIGERGREVNEFLERDLGAEGLRRSVVVVATADRLPLIRTRGAFLATAVAEYFRDRGARVNLMMDSVTRFAMAQREIGLALGEPPTTKGYTPTTFTLLPKLLERAGTCAGPGSITGLYTVLVEGDDTNEPIADAARSVLDGHIVLSRDLARQNHYPAIDVLASLSRLMDGLVTEEQRALAGRLRELLAVYRKSEDLVQIGAYVPGSNPRLDTAIRMLDEIQAFLRQGVNERVPFDASWAQLAALLARC
ncbi:MAG: FliI/YscN family ATPase [Desulfobacterales bacterium]